MAAEHRPYELASDRPSGDIVRKMREKRVVLGDALEIGCEHPIEEPTKDRQQHQLAIRILVRRV